jgi:glutamate/tyrosine decarboxylase-like PLP-dependent enzyme
LKTDSGFGQDFISQGVRDTAGYKEKSQELDDKLSELLVALGKFSIPFYNPRYSAHMTTDQTLPAILGYLSTMFYNPNNVAFEASPFTTQLEITVGRQLCDMLGFGPHTDNTDAPWGHITCDGSVANLESVW